MKITASIAIRIPRLVSLLAVLFLVVMSNGQQQNLNVGFVRKGTQVIIGIDSIKILKNKEPISVIRVDSNNTAVVLFQDSTFGQILNFQSTAATWMVKVDIDTLKRGPKPPHSDPPIGGPRPIPINPPKGPQAQYYKPLSEKEIKTILLDNNIDNAAIKEKMKSKGY